MKFKFYWLAWLAYKDMRQIVSRQLENKTYFNLYFLS